MLEQIFTALVSSFVLWIAFSVAIYQHRISSDRERRKRQSLYPGESPKGKITSSTNAVALFYKLREVDWKNKFKPKTEIEKEIKNKKREIEQLKKHKEDIKELEELEREYDSLFKSTIKPNERHFMRHESFCAKCDEWYWGERCPNHNAVDPLPFLEQAGLNQYRFKNTGQSMDEVGKSYQKAMENITSDNCPRCGSTNIDRTIAGNSLHVTTTIHCNDCEFECERNEVEA